jgi:hypothetical protein
VYLQDDHNKQQKTPQVNQKAKTSKGQKLYSKTQSKEDEIDKQNITNSPHLIHIDQWEKICINI